MKDKLQELVDRRHPKWAGCLDHWNFVEATYEGGRDWFATNIFKYIKEGDKEYEERVKRAYRFNHTRQVVDLVNKYLFKMPVARKDEDVSDALRAFWERATLKGLDIDSYMKRVSALSSQYGRVWLVVDSNAIGGTFSRADEKSGKVRIYSYIVRPQEMLDMSYDEEGNLNWCLIHEILRDDADPMDSSGSFRNQYRLWTKQEWMLFEETTVRGKRKIVLIDSGVHGLGQVPVEPADHNISEEQYTAPSLVDDVAYLDRANANYLSNLDAIIQDQTFSQLAMPAQGVLPGEDGYDKLTEMGTKRVFLYDGQAGARPEYLSPDVKQAKLILEAITKIVGEIYSSVGLTAARTGHDAGGGLDTESGVSKAYDFEGVNALLASKAVSLETTERRLAALVDLWAGVRDAEDSIDQTCVTYPRDFDTRGLYDEFEIAARLSLLGAPDSVRRAQMATVVEKLFPAASEEMEKEMESELKSWPPKDEVTGLGDKTPTAPGKKSAGDPIAAASTQKTAKELAA